MLSSSFSQNKAEIKNGNLAYSITTNKYTPLHTGIFIFPNWIIIHFQYDLSYLQNGKLPKYIKSVTYDTPQIRYLTQNWTVFINTCFTVFLEKI